MNRPAPIVVGTSSWADPGFVADWYPQGLPARDRLGWYAERFEAVEVNSSYYALPAERTVARWAEVTPSAFTFDVKLHRLLSRHAAPLDSLPKELRDRVDATPRGRVVLTPDLEAIMADNLLGALGPLIEAGKLRSLLLQLSPSFSPDRHELSELDPLIERLAPWPVAVELRHRGWVAEKRVESTLGHLSDRGAAFVCVDAPPGEHVPIMPALDAVTRGDLAYLRAHGRNTEGYVKGRTVAERFGWVYSDEELGQIAERARALGEDAGEVRVMFNNNRDDDAPTAARRLRELIGQDPGPAPGEAEEQQTLL
ncbi:MAG: DUF72 domain-containing protein [Thermoleophilaceae bacterium]|nr:DUF72 domain-containing protein [Thermoleophilaceae bacterium]MBA3839217.1 DUF72 domain-containing protein [Thermoleophilaceae bacterium]